MDKPWTKAEVLQLLKKKEDNIAKEIEIVDNDARVDLVLRFPFLINFDRGNWKLFCKTKEELWKKLEDGKLLFDSFNPFGDDFESFLKHLCTELNSTMNDIWYEWEGRFQIEEGGYLHNGDETPKVYIAIPCETTQDAVKVITRLEKILSQQK